ncbi:uncharacterized protein ACNLHF_002384 [Anomaloglossus baeobatrachus]
MKNLVALLFMISVLVIPAFSNQCNFCESCTTTCEEETKVECGTKRCMTFSKYIHLHSLTEKGPNITFIKGCADESLCKRGQQTMWMSQEIAHCCSGDSCNTRGFEYNKGFLGFLHLEKPKYIMNKIDINDVDWSKATRINVTELLERWRTKFLKRLC